MKKLITLILAIFMLFGIKSAYCAGIVLEYNGEKHDYSGSIYTLMVNGEYIETSVPPIIFNDYALVPIRDVVEPMGAKVNYIDVSKQVFINFGENYMRLKINSNTASVNEKDTAIPGGVSPMLISVNGCSAKTMVPVRFVAEKLGFNVDFDSENGIIKITSPSEIEKSVINNYKASVSGDTATVKLTFDKAVSEYTKPAMTNSNVLYFDISNCSYSLPSTTEINKGAIKNLRFGIHGDNTRIAFDLENYKSYKVIFSNDKKTVTVSVVGLSSASDLPNNENTENKQPDKTPVTASEKIVVIDAGHGGSDPGTSGTLSGIKYNEKDINLSVAKKVQKLLADTGITVMMTRDKDTYPTLSERSDFANLNDAALFVSIHSNWASSETASGFEIYYSTQNNSSATGLSSKELADSVIKAVDKEIDTRNRGIKTENHVVTRTSNMPAILIEIGFMSNAEELSLMISDDFQNSFAQGIANGIAAVIDHAGIPSECGLIYEEIKAAREAEQARLEAQKLTDTADETAGTENELTEDNENEGNLNE